MAQTSVTYLKAGRGGATSHMTMARKITLLGSLYLTQGVPFGFFTQAFPSLMRKQGYSLEAIGAATVLALPWALKFLWAPAVDRFSFRSFGRRKSWLVPLQALICLTLLTVAALSVERLSAGVLVIVLAVNFMIASQDIASDGLAVDVLSEGERGIANGVQVAGYRLGMIIGGGLLLIAFDRFGWAATFASMAVLVALASIPVLAYREPDYTAQVSSSETPNVMALIRRPGMAHAIVLIIVYKFGEAFAGGMVRPLLVDAGLSLTDIGSMLGGVGFGAVLLGGLIGGALVNRLGRKNALAWFAAFQALAVGGYAYLAAHPGERIVAYGISAAEHFASGMANAALFTCMMDWSLKETGATDYTAQASAVVAASGMASTLSGFSAGKVGYFAHFMLAAGLAVVAVIAALSLYPKTPGIGRS